MAPQTSQEAQVDCDQIAPFSVGRRLPLAARRLTTEINGNIPTTLSRDCRAKENELKTSRSHHELRLFGYFHLISAIGLHTASRRLDCHALTTRCDKVV